MTRVDFYDPSFYPVSGLTYSVIAARHNGRWLFVRHQDRTTWEIAGGHIENNESPDAAACRELSEETGAIRFDISCVATYSVEKDGFTGYGRLYFAEVSERGEVPDTSEIAEVVELEELPDDLTYPDIQPNFFKKILEYIDNTGTIY